jgi:hypothetical protein
LNAACTGGQASAASKPVLVCSHERRQADCGMDMNGDLCRRKNGFLAC